MPAIPAARGRGIRYPRNTAAVFLVPVPIVRANSADGRIDNCARATVGEAAASLLEPLVFNMRSEYNLQLRSWNDCGPGSPEVIRPARAISRHNIRAVHNNNCSDHNKRQEKHNEWMTNSGRYGSKAARMNPGKLVWVGLYIRT